MKLGLINREEIARLSPPLRDDLDSLIARIQTTWNVEHHADGTHHAGVGGGQGVSVPYAATAFTASTGTWTVEAGDQRVFRYYRVGSLLRVVFWLLTTSVSATPSELRVAVPGGFTVPAHAIGQGALVYSNAGAALAQGVCTVLPGNAFIACAPAGFANWATATHTTSVNGDIWFEIA